MVQKHDLSKTWKWTYNLTGATDYFVADRFRCWAVGGGSLTIQQSSDAPAGFQNSLMFTVNTADTDALSVKITHTISCNKE